MLGQCHDNSTCLNGGWCSPATHTCQCAPGWTNDHVAFLHQENCSLPEDMLYWFFAIFTALAIVSFAALLYFAFNARQTVKKMRDFFLAWLVIDWAVVLTVHLEGGFYRAACIFNAFFIIFAMSGPVYFAFNLLAAYFKLTPQLNARKIESRFKIMLHVWNFILTLPCYVGAAVFAVGDMNHVYNWFIVAWMIEYGLILLVYLTFILVFFKRFHDLVGNVLGTAAAPKPDAFVTRRQTTHGGAAAGQAFKPSAADMHKRQVVMSRIHGILLFCVCFIPFGLMYIAIAIVLLAGSNVPYLWVVWIMLMSTPVLLIGPVIKAVKDDTFATPTGGGVTASASKNNSKENVLAAAGANTANMATTIGRIGNRDSLTNQRGMGEDTNEEEEGGEGSKVEH